MKQTIRCVKEVPDSVEVVLNTIKPDSFVVVVHHRSINWLVPE
jgi:hypothetical protein